MEVTCGIFESKDPDFQKNISEAIKAADFAAIDLEFSGVARRAASLGRKQNVQERYLQLKEGADKYQILQLGLCLAKYNKNSEEYICQPFTFPVSPVTDSKWGYEREFSFQSSAIQFLSQNNLDFNFLFTHGIPYLNHDEERQIRQREERALDGDMEEIHVEDGQKKFLEDVVKELEAWVDDPKPRYDFVNITGPGQEINGYQKRLVHQLVRRKFPDLATQGRPNFIQVTKKNPAYEAKKRKERLLRSNSNIQRGIGLRFIVDALRERQIPLVGHNLFGDLIHLYRGFVGPLPETLEQFGAMVHKDFPAVCDTKYMATCEGYCSSEASSLQVLSETLELLRNPTINLHPEHFSGVLHHNAGYDSFITARVLIKLITNYQNHLKFEKIGSQGITNARQKMVAFVNQMGTNHEIRALHGDSLVPDFQNNLWNGFKNRLRVNGTVEGIVVLEEEENGGVKLDTSNTEMDLL